MTVPSMYDLEKQFMLLKMLPATYFTSVKCNVVQKVWFKSLYCLHRLYFHYNMWFFFFFFCCISSCMSVLWLYFNYFLVYAIFIIRNFITFSKQNKQNTYVIYQVDAWKDPLFGWEVEHLLYNMTLNKASLTYPSYLI